MTLQLGAILAAVLALFGGGWYCGGLRARTQLEAQHAAQLAAVAAAYQDQALIAQALHAHLQEVINAYDANKDLPDPVSVGVAHRLYLVAAGASCAVPEAGSLAGGTITTSPVPIGPSAVESRLNDYIAACSADAKQLKAVIQLAPK